MNCIQSKIKNIPIWKSLLSIRKSRHSQWGRVIRRHRCNFLGTIYLKCSACTAKRMKMNQLARRLRTMGGWGVLLCYVGEVKNGLRRRRIFIQMRICMYCFSVCARSAPTAYAWL